MVIRAYISVVSSGKCFGMLVNFFCLQSAIPSAHLQALGQVHSKLAKQLSAGSLGSIPKITLYEMLSVIDKNRMFIPISYYNNEKCILYFVNTLYVSNPIPRDTLCVTT